MPRYNNTPKLDFKRPKSPEKKIKPKTGPEEGQNYFDLNQEVERFRRSGAFKLAEAARAARLAREAK